MENTRRILIEAEVLNGKYDSEYAEYIMEHAPGDRIICNGNTLIIAMEDGYLFDDFVDFLENQE